MQFDAIRILINPYNKQPLSWKLEKGREFLIDQSGNQIPVIEGIPDFLVLEDTKGLNLKYRRFYDKLSRLGGIAEKVYSIFHDLKKMRMELMREVEINENWKVLETSAGTGWNFRVLPANACYFGLDISRGMLRQAQKNEKRWNIQMELFQGNAEYLPFADKSFDSVFHVGGINFFNDRKRAIEEMIRVAKPGTRIVIIDETEERIRNYYQRIPMVRKYFAPEDIDPARTMAPVELVPENVTELMVKLLDRGKMYQLSFRTAC